MTIELDDKTGELLKAQARARGMSLEEFLRTVVDSVTQAPTMSLAPSADVVRDFDAALDELFSGDSREFPATAQTYPRQDIYADHD